ncbi:MAG: ABC transporter permease [Vicinamibacterales bacterium]|nr:ABC transporter permease [Vicinamibacterales bacterium]
MKGWQAALEVARWEFRRFFKLRDQIISLVIAFVMVAAGYGVGRWMGADEPRPTLVTSGIPQEWLAALPPDVRTEDAAGREASALRAAVAAREFDGILTSTERGPALLVRKHASWQARVVTALQAWHRDQRLAAAGLTADQLKQLLDPVPVPIELVSGDAGIVRAERVAAGVAGALMFIGIISGLSYMFVGITGEKQLRVTEQVVSAISPQAWIDGKILGLSGVAAASTIGYAVSALVIAVASRWAGLTWPWPAALGQPAMLVGIVVLALLGFAFWNTFIGAIAASITDPNTSSRGGLLMLPMLPVVFALMAIGDPDTTAMRVLAVLPPTASFVMLVRLVAGDPVWWEIAAAIALLAGSTWLLRVAAGRIFRLAMMAYGKEPTWRELWQWARITTPGS